MHYVRFTSQSGPQRAAAGVPEPPALQHLPYLDGARALACLYVLFHHVLLQVWPFFSDRRPTGRVLAVVQWLYYGWFGVMVFLVISGFCLMLPVVRDGGLKNARKFYYRRARRILPPYYAALALSLLLIMLWIGDETGTHWDISVPVDGLAVAGHVLLVQDFLGSPQINHVFWSIAAECQIYLLFPLLVSSWYLRGPARTAGLVAVVVYALVMLVSTLPLPRFAVSYLSQLFGLLILFLCGMAAAAVAFGAGTWARLRTQIPWTGVAAGAAGVVILCCVAMDEKQVNAQMVWLQPFVGVATAAALISGHGGGLIGSVLAWRPLVLIGTFSYSIYLIHAPLLQLFWKYVMRPYGLDAAWEFLVLAALGVPAILVLAYLFFVCFERPFLRQRTPDTRTMETQPEEQPRAAVAGA